MFAGDLIGIGKADMCFLCAVLNIPRPPDSWDSVHEAEVCHELKQLITEKLTVNREYVNSQCLKTANGNALITIKADGTYQMQGDIHCGYTSEIGVVLIIDADSNKALDY